jgi:hypothetical protein
MEGTIGQYFRQILAFISIILKYTFKFTMQAKLRIILMLQ